MGGADDGGAADNDNGPQHDALHDDAGRCRGPRDIRLRTRPQRGPVRPEGPRCHAGDPGAGPEGDIRQGGSEIR